MAKRVCIIGAGASGLAAIKVCLEDGLEPFCFEMNNDIGGLWRYEEGERTGACVYKSTIINTSKEIMCFSTFPIPKEFPNYMHHTKVMEYYRMFCNEFDLEKHIKFHTKVLSCTETDDHKDTGRWCVKTQNTKTGVEKSEVFDGIMVAVGHHAIPNLPLDSFPGIEKFKGKYMHSHLYRNHDGFEGKKVVVVGIGNSGGDIAVDLSRIADQTYLSTRSGAWVFYRVDKGGMPVDVNITTRLGKIIDGLLPSSLVNTLGEAIANAKFDHELYGLRPKHRVFSQHPMVNDDLPNRVLSGTLKIKGNVTSFTEKGVYFEDGEYEDVDIVIFATGFNFAYPFLNESVVKVNQNRTKLYKYMWPPNVKKSSLAIIGAVQPLGATIPLSELQCRWATQVFKGLVKLPSQVEMNADIDKKLSEMKRRYYDSPRHTVQGAAGPPGLLEVQKLLLRGYGPQKVDHVDYMDEVAEQIGVKPNILKLFLTDPALASKVLFEVASPYQYRLSGPGKWPKAREMIMTQMERIKFPLQSRPSVTRAEPSQFAWIKQVVFILILGVIFYKLF